MIYNSNLLKSDPIRNEEMLIDPANPCFSVIIPTYNRAHLLSRAIKSVLSQSFHDFELIIVDDGSKDNTKQVVQGIKDHRIRYFRQKENKGQNSALNFGVSKVRGKYVSFLDSDDEWLSKFLEKIKTVFEKDKSVGAAYSKAYGCTNSGKLYDGYQFYLHGEVYKEVLSQGYLSYMITIVVKKEIINNLGSFPFDPSFIYGQDDDFCFRVAKMCKIGLVKEPLAIIHNDGDVKGNEPSISKNVKLVAEGRQRLINKYADDILQICGKSTLSSKYFSLGVIYLRCDNIEMAKVSFTASYKLKKTIQSALYLLYARFSVIRKIWNFILAFYRHLKNKVKNLILRKPDTSTHIF